MYINNENAEREIKETVPFTISSKRIKYFGRNISKEAKIYTPKTIRPDERNQRWYKQMEGYTMFLDWNNQYCQNDILLKAIYRFSAIPIKLPMAFFI